MHTNDLRYWLALIRLPGVGPARLHPLLSQGMNARDIVEQLPAQADNVLQRALTALSWEAVEQDLKWLEQKNNHFLAWNDPAYPDALRDLPDAPVGLFLHGNMKALDAPQIALVGSRNPTQSGRQNAHDFAFFLANAGITITSGLALGIDAASHRGALDANGSTIAVTATGLDRVYPASNQPLAHAIAEQGLLISEFPLGTPPRPGHFPRRNRIISGLSLGVLVVEAALKSGSLITAQRALEQSREVFAIPGSIHNPLSRGCHQLIKQGAKLVETGADILEELAPFLSRFVQPTATLAEPLSSQTTERDDDYSDLLNAMGYDPVSVDALSASTGLPPATVSSMLLLLELEGRVSSESGGLFTRL